MVCPNRERDFKGCMDQAANEWTVIVARREEILVDFSLSSNTEEEPSSLLCPFFQREWSPLHSVFRLLDVSIKLHDSQWFRIVYHQVQKSSCFSSQGQMENVAQQGPTRCWIVGTGVRNISVSSIYGPNVMEFLQIDRTDKWKAKLNTLDE